MTNVITGTTAVNNKSLDDRLDDVDAGGAAGTLELYASGVLTTTYTLSYPAWAAASGGSKVLNAVADVTHSATGTLTTATFFDSNGVEKDSGSVGLSGAMVNVNTLSAVSGETASISSGSSTI